MLNPGRVIEVTLTFPIEFVPVLNPGRVILVTLTFPIEFVPVERPGKTQVTIPILFAPELSPGRVIDDTDTLPIRLAPVGNPALIVVLKISAPVETIKPPLVVIWKGAMHSEFIVGCVAL